MGRELKRVPLDFDWPIGQVWKGYLNPYSAQGCKPCRGSGFNPATKKLSDDWYTHLRSDGEEGWQYHLEQEDVDALVAEGRLWDFVRVPVTPEQEEVVKKKIEAGGNSWLPYDNGYKPTAEEVNKWARTGMGHDALNHWICVRARAKRLGVFGSCPHCKGEGVVWYSEEIKKLSEEWERCEPPSGDGYQLWETTSEGSPKSPVFNSIEELCKWCAENATTFGSFKASAAEWRQMLDDNFVCHEAGRMVFF